MPFQPLVNDVLQIDETLYRITEHPTAPGLPYGQEGRQATVYQLIADPAANAAGPADRRAIKAFKPRFRSPALVVLSERLAAFADMPGLAVCRRQVLTPSRHRALLATHPDLIYSVVMPWIDGPTWFEIVADRRPLTPAQALGLARSLTSILCQMEQRGLAHCDLSGSNIILPGLIEGRPADAGEAVALVDVELMFGPGLDQPVATTSGSPGYQLSTDDPNAWNATADRFAGAILLTEMLGWCDERARSAAWGESYFEPNEHQRETEQYRLMTTVLTERWGPGVARLLDRAWQSTVQSECPTFGEWQMALPDTAPAAPSPRPAAGWSAAAAVGAAVAQPPPVANAADDTAARTLYDLGRQREAAGDREMARTLYQQALALAPVGGALALELNAALAAATAAPVPPGGELAMPPTNAQPTPDAAPPTRPTTPDPEIEMLFDDALVAYGAQDLDRTRQLLRDVLRRQPNYARDGQTAQALLTEVDQRLAPAGAAKAGAAGAVVGAAGAATGAAGQTSAPASPTPRPGGSRRPAGSPVGRWPPPSSSPRCSAPPGSCAAALAGATARNRRSRPPASRPPRRRPSRRRRRRWRPSPPRRPRQPSPLSRPRRRPQVHRRRAPRRRRPPRPRRQRPRPRRTPSVAPAVTAAGKLVILYSSHRPEIHDLQIWSMGVDGSNPQSFTATRGHSWAPRVSPDGQRFFFSSVAPGEHVSHDPTGGGTSKNPGNHDIYVSSADASDIAERHRRASTPGTMPGPGRPTASGSPSPPTATATGRSTR